MNKKKDSRSSDFGEQKNGKLNNDVVNSITDSINRKKSAVKLPAAIETMRSLLSHGQENAHHASEIEAVTGLFPRDQRHAVLWMREHDEIVIGDNYGYYRPKNDTEIEVWVKKVKAIIRTHQRAIATAERYLRERKRNNPDQIGLDDLGLI